MKIRHILVFSLFIFSGVWSHAKPFLRVIQPYQDWDIPYVEKSFVFGSVLPATSTIYINGIKVKPHTNGAFIGIIPFQPGRFEILVVADDGVEISSVTRQVNVAMPLDITDPMSEEIKPGAPLGRVVIRHDDSLDFVFRGPPGGEASFKFRKAGDTYPMREERPGYYVGTYIVQKTDRFDEEGIIFYLRRSDGKKLSKKIDTEITVQRRRTPRIIELREDSILLTGPGSSYGYSLFFQKGVRLEVTGEFGPFYRVSLNSVSHGWVKKSFSVELPAGTPQAKSVAHNIRINSTEESTVLELPLKYVHPHRVEQFVKPHRLDLTLYGVIADTDRIRYKSRNSVIKEILWKQVEPETYTLQIDTKQEYPWGYEVRYEGTSLFLEIRHKPPWKADRSKSLRGIRIAVDAGHSKNSFGTIGPWGNTEASVNLMVAREVQRAFEAKGADVIMIQDGTKEPSLQDRVDLAWKKKSNLFISIHADACGEGQDPWELEGYSVHYYQPQSRLLAESVQEYYGQKTKIRDQGLWRSNLAVCRTTLMPSILLEQGFLILPEFEELMLTKGHHQKVAESLVDAVWDFLNKNK